MSFTKDNILNTNDQYEWLPELRAVIARIHAPPRPKFATHYFCRPDGTPFITEGLDTSAFGNI